MKLTILIIQVTALSALAQGTVIFDNNVPGLLVTHIYYGLDWHPKQGNGPNDTPPGTQDYSGMALVEGPGFSAQLFAVPGIVDNDVSLQPASPVTTLGTGDQAGFVIPMIAELANVPPDSPVATLQLRVWDNWGGTLKDWFAAVAVSAPIGGSPMFTVHNIGGPNNAPPYLIGLESFALIPIPEPSAFTLVGLGAGALLIHRRKRTPYLTGLTSFTLYQPIPGSSAGAFALTGIVVLWLARRRRASST